MPWVKYQLEVPQLIDVNGSPAVSYSINAYVWDTSIPLAMATDSAGNGQATSFEFNSSGKPQTSGGTAVDIFLDSSKVYKFIYEDADGVALDPTIGPVYPIGNGEKVTLSSLEALYSNDHSNLSHVETVAFAEGGSKGGAEFYKGASGGTQTTSGTLYTHLALGYVVDAGGNYWHFKPDQQLNVYMFGAEFDGVADDYIPVQTYVNSGITDAEMPQGECLLSQTVVVPVGVYINGAGSVYEEADAVATTFKPMAASTAYYEADGTQTANGYLFFMNVDPASPATWIDQFPNIGAGGINNVNIDGTATGGIKGAYFGGGYEFENIYTTKVYTAVRCIDSIYHDHIKVHRVHARQRPDQTAYLVHLNALGDNWSIEGISPGYTGSETGITNGVYIGLCRGGRVDKVINGNHRIVGTKTLTVSQLHQEGGNLTIENANVHIIDSLFFNDEDDNIPIVLENSLSGSNQRYSVSVDNVTFSKTITKNGWASTEVPDIQVADVGISLQLGRGCRRTVSISGEISKSQVMGILVENSAGSISDWQNYSHILTKEGTVVEAAKTDITGHTINLENNFGGWASASAATFGSGAAAATFKAATATYYYGIQLLIDPVRLLGKSADTTAEVSVAATLSGTSLPSLIVSLGSVSSHGGYILRVYRGTSTGNYDKYIDIPAISVKNLIDDGNALNGFVWRSRSAGGVDTLNNKAWAGPCQWIDNRVTIHGKSGILTAGTWKAGDHCIRTNSAVDGNNMHLEGYFRLTDGSGHVSGTDWAPRYVSTVSPAS